MKKRFQVGWGDTAAEQRPRLLLARQPAAVEVAFDKPFTATPGCTRTTQKAPLP